MNFSLAVIAAIVFLIVSWVIAIINREVSSTNFAIWSIAVLMVFSGLSL